MASFRTRTSGSARTTVDIRKKNYKISKTFSDEETAHLFAKYKEDVISDMEAFEAPESEVITLDSAIEWKISKMQEDGRDPKSIADVKNVRKDFYDWIDLPLSSLTYEKLLEKANEMLKSPVRRGGNPNNNTGKLGIQSPVTVKKKFANLSCIISEMNKGGLNIENHAFRLLGFLQQTINSGKINV